MSRLFSKFHKRCCHIFFIRHESTPSRELRLKSFDVEPEEKLFKKILIANRGEIACRIIGTCKALGIKTVAIFSECDINERHTKLADERICIGPASSKSSYLNIDAIVKACKHFEVDAVHPGYGFLSENAEFPKRLCENGITFIGPNFLAIQTLGDKITSKKIASSIGLFKIPGYDEEIQDISNCLRVANEIGYPVMLKAVAGGGGKGMRILRNNKECCAGFDIAKHEALANFGDDRMLVEKFIDNARHIEMQILCDKHGNAIWLNERECSVQRRNQKLIEEAPSPCIDAKTRLLMGQQACLLALKADYDSAGTVEFLVDANGDFYFLEMNTRLQVEYPVTEAITGIDLVHQMIRVAYGHKIDIKQDDVQSRGHSIECRICAENPYKFFGLPSIGRLIKYKEPDSNLARCDSGVQEGSKIGSSYDSLMSKLITHGQTRLQAIEKMAEALDTFVIRGVSNNLVLLRDIISQQSFINGDLSIDYLSKTYSQGFVGPKLTNEELNCLAVLSTYISQHFIQRSHEPFSDAQISNLQQNFSIQIPITDDSSSSSPFQCETSVIQNGKQVTICVANEEVVFDTPLEIFNSYFQANILGRIITCQLVSKEFSEHIILIYKGHRFRIQVWPKKVNSLSKYMKVKKKLKLNNLIVSPMPGLIKTISVVEGQAVSDGQEICVIEAMKMQNSLMAEYTGKVLKVNCQIGESVDAGVILVELE